MISLSIIFWTFVLALLSFILDDTILLLFAAIVLGFYALLLASDLFLLFRVVRQKKHRAFYDLKLFTEIGHWVGEYLGKLLYYLEELEWEARERGSCEGESVSWKSFPDLSGHGRFVDENQFYDLILSNGMERLRAAAAALVLYPVGGGEPKVVLSNVGGDSFVRFLLHFLSSVPEARNSYSAVITDGVNSDSVFGEFSIYGYPWIICRSVDLSASGKWENGVLWFGYGKNRAPYATEPKWIDGLCERVASEYQLLTSVDRLQKKAIHAESASNNRSEYIAQVSHDMRTPLHNIKSILTLLSLDSEQEDQDELISVALHNCREMSEILEDVLDFSRYQAGQLIARQDSFDLCQGIAEVVEGFKVAARLKSLELDLQLGENAAYAFVDKKHFKRIVSNLVGNAIKYTRAGTISVGVSVSSGGVCEIQITDTGIGIDSRDLSRIFEPFQRCVENEIEGVGLGLALTKVLVNLNGGSLSVRSNLDIGSTFTISFPSCSVIVASPVSEDLVESVNANFINAASGRVLVLDDDFDCAESLGEGLRRAGFDVVVTTSLQEAIGFSSYDKFDFVISDASLQDGTVRQLLRVVQKQDGAPSVIVITGYCDYAERESYLQLGALKVLEKPIDLDSLLPILNERFPLDEQDPQKKVA